MIGARHWQYFWLGGVIGIAALTLVLSGIRATPSDTSVVASSGLQSSVGRNEAFRDIAATAVARSSEQLGRPGGFYLTPKYHIPLPDSMDAQVRILDRRYASTLHVAVEKAINRAAEETVLPADYLVLKALATQSLAVGPELPQGAADAVTRALRRHIETSLREAMRPVVRTNLAKMEAPAALERMQTRYEQMTGIPFPTFDLVEYTLDRFVAVYFSSLAEQEQKLRLRPLTPLDNPTNRQVSSE